MSDCQLTNCFMNYWVCIGNLGKAWGYEVLAHGRKKHPIYQQQYFDKHCWLRLLSKLPIKAEAYFNTIDNYTLKPLYNHRARNRRQMVALAANDESEGRCIERIQYHRKLFASLLTPAELRHVATIVLPRWSLSEVWMYSRGQKSSGISRKCNGIKHWLHSWLLSLTHLQYFDELHII